MIIFWIGIFILSLMVLVRGADWFLGASEKFGLAKGLSKFIVGVIIVGVGTSLPELASSFVALFSGAPEIVAGNAIGSNIANILLIVGLSVVLAGRLVTTKYLIDIDIPLLVITTILFLISAWDKVITRPEALLLLVGYGFYFMYTMKSGDAEKTEISTRPKFTSRDWVLMVAGLLGLIFGSKYLVDSVLIISDLIGVSAGALSLAAVAVGTSLPELTVSVRAAMQGKSEVALGNIFGSNVFNLLVVVGLPAVFQRIPLDSASYTIGLPFLIIATVLFLISGISQKMYVWEGAMSILVYIFFIGKLFNFF